MSQRCHGKLLKKHSNLDDPQIVERSRRMIRQKPFLQKIYDEWYAQLNEAIPAGEGPVLELGAGGGFLKARMPGLITSDILMNPHVDLIADGCRLPLKSGKLRAIVMTNVFHHLPDVHAFLQEATRCVRPGGVIVMVEPWVSFWSRGIYGHVHYEHFAPNTDKWNFSPRHPMSESNNALAWVVFERDRQNFEDLFPEWQLQPIVVGMPFRYLLSGGISLPSLMPGWMFGFWRKFEQLLGPWMPKLALFAQIVLVRRPTECRTNESSDRCAVS